MKSNIDAFIILGEFLSQFKNKESEKKELEINKKYYVLFKQLIETIHFTNPWFTEEFVRFAIKGISNMLTSEKLTSWVNKYPDIEKNKQNNKIAVIMAGNIPMVGFHDMLCVLISGNTFIGKQSSKDNLLLSTITNILIDINPNIKEKIYWQDAKLSGFDAVIATGSNNSSRYFDFYFAKYPSIIRKNRNSIAILSGNETNIELNKLADDIFIYFGMGCRNVSKLFVPENYNFDSFFQSIEHYHFLYNYNKYANNYDYNRSIYLLNKEKHLDNGFVLLKHDKNFYSPIATIFYENYKTRETLFDYLALNNEIIQCTVSNMEFFTNCIPFGKAQEPELWDYADNIDVINFLLTLKKN